MVLKASDSPCKEVILKALTRLNEKSTSRAAAEELSIIVRVGPLQAVGNSTAELCHQHFRSVTMQRHPAKTMFVCAGFGPRKSVSTCTKHLQHNRSMGAKASGKKGERQGHS